MVRRARQVPAVVRARSSTLSAQGAGLAGGAGAGGGAARLELPPRPARADDSVSLCPSVNSRKDSGIRSTSRRSSIQQQVTLGSRF